MKNRVERCGKKFYTWNRMQTFKSSTEHRANMYVGLYHSICTRYAYTEFKKFFIFLLDLCI